jgi:hypothetical protein
MEYEISDEHVLFDPSTNPSLDKAGSSLRRPPRLPAKGTGQKAVTIPEEEQQAA